MTMSTYKSLGGPAGGLLVANDARAGRTGGRDRLSRADRELRRRQDRRARRGCWTGRNRAGVHRGDGRHGAPLAAAGPGCGVPVFAQARARPDSTSSRSRPRRGAARSGPAARGGPPARLRHRTAAAPWPATSTGCGSARRRSWRLGATAGRHAGAGRAARAGPGRADRRPEAVAGEVTAWRAAVPRRALHRGLSRAAPGDNGAMTMPRKFESAVEAQIRLAQERGDFDRLPGHGKPIPGAGQPDDELWWVKGRPIKREGLETSALLPLSLRLRKEVEDLPAKVRGLRTEAAVRAEAADLNQRIATWIPPRPGRRWRSGRWTWRTWWPAGGPAARPRRTRRHRPRRPGGGGGDSGAPDPDPVGGEEERWRRRPSRRPRAGRAGRRLDPAVRLGGAEAGAGCPGCASSSSSAPSR